MTDKKNLTLVQAEEYFTEHEIQPLLTELLVHLGKTRPSKPISAMCDFLRYEMEKRGETTASNAEDDNCSNSNGSSSPLFTNTDQPVYARHRRDNVFSEPIDENSSFEFPVFEKTEEEKAFLRKCLKQSTLFSNMDPHSEENIVNAFEKTTHKQGQVVIQQNDTGDKYYVLFQGVCHCFIRNESWQLTPQEQAGHGRLVKRYEKQGESFGELALLYNSARAATIVVESEEAVLFALDRITFRTIVAKCSQREREVQMSFIEGIELLKGLDLEERRKLLLALKGESFEKGDCVVEEGEMGDCMYFMDEGVCQAMQKDGSGGERECFRPYVAGDYFGELSLLQSRPRACSVRVVSPTARLFALYKDDFERLLGPIIPILRRNMGVYESYAQYIGPSGSSS